MVRSIPKLGGTKDVNLRRLRELAPTHVIVNIDENEKPTVDEIRETVPHVIATHPLAPLDNVALYRLLGGIFDVLPMAEKLAAQLIDAYDDVVASCSALPRRDVRLRAAAHKNAESSAYAGEPFIGHVPSSRFSFAALSG